MSNKTVSYARLRQYFHVVGNSGINFTEARDVTEQVFRYMQLKDPININLLEFFKTGRFDYIKLGQTKQWILDNFPDPDDLEVSPEIYHRDIWSYGNFEFHFDKNELFLIHCGWLKSISGGRSIELEKWIFLYPEDLILSFVLEQLNLERINYQMEHQRFGQTYSAKVTVQQNGITLGFSPERALDMDPLKHALPDNSNLFLCDGFNLYRG